MRLVTGILISGVLCLPVAGSDDKTDLKKAEILTREGVLGSKWKGAYKGGAVELEFRSTEDKKFLSVLVTIKTVGALTIGNTLWDLDSKKNEVKFGNVIAKPAKDGVLVLNGNITFGLTTYTFKEVRVERVKEAKK